MLISDKLAKYRSKSTCNLDMFRVQPQFHESKTWKSKDGKVSYIVQMESMHLWHCYNMLMRLIDEGSQAQEYAALNALQYIGHELFVRKMTVPRLPDPAFRKHINHADNLEVGFADTDNAFDFTFDLMDVIGTDWNNGDFYKWNDND
jgi:hypothetical protein